MKDLLAVIGIISIIFIWSLVIYGKGYLEGLKDKDKLETLT